jgi:hypothetical protein
MKKLLLILFMLCLGKSLTGQTQPATQEGSVSYVTTQNIYVKFASTQGISSGDTLYSIQNGKTVPTLVVKELSSTSCVCIPITATKFNVADRVVSKSTNAPSSLLEEGTPTPAVVPAVVPPNQVKDTLTSEKPIVKKSSQSIHGRLSISSYTNFSNTPAENRERLQYTMAVNARNLGNSGASVETYMIFLQKLDSAGRNEIQQNIFNGLKIYSLAVNYDFGKSYSLLLGRKINPKLSNMGAVDGLQFEMRFKPITVGIIAGSRPDYEDYGFNFNLLQFGGYLYNEIATKNGPVQSTLAVVQQNNSGKTDRRFLYLQHSNSIVKNLNFFGTAELDLYNMELVTDSLNPQDTLKKNNGPRLTNLYLSLRYRVTKQLSLSLSYSNRQNIVYYETNKSYLDKLLEFETTQGYLFQVNYRPIKRLFIGATVGYRYQQKDPKPSSNVNAYITYSDIPGIHLSATGTVLILQTSYLTGQVYGLTLSRDFAKGKLYSSLGYKYVNYKFSYSDVKLPQNVGEVNLTWRIYKRIALSAYYEGTFENVNQFNRIYAQLNYGF